MELKPRPLAELEKKATKLLRDDPAFYNPPPREKDRDFIWLQPELVVEASFLEWTPLARSVIPFFKVCAKTNPRQP